MSNETTGALGRSRQVMRNGRIGQVRLSQVCLAILLSKINSISNFSSDFYEFLKKLGFACCRKYVPLKKCPSKMCPMKIRPSKKRPGAPDQDFGCKRNQYLGPSQTIVNYVEFMTLCEYYLMANKTCLLVPDLPCVQKPELGKKNKHWNFFQSLTSHVETKKGKTQIIC